MYWRDTTSFKLALGLSVRKLITSECFVKKKVAFHVFWGLHRFQIGLA